MFSSNKTAGVERNGDHAFETLKVEVVHAIPGRVRLRITELKESPDLASCLGSRFKTVERLNSFEVRPQSNSVVLHYEPTAQSAFSASLRTLFPQLVDARQRNHPAAQGDSPQEQDFAGTIAGLFATANKNVERATGGIDLKLLVPVALLTLSVLGMLATAVRQRRLPMPTWYDLLWFAFNTFVILNLTMSRQTESNAAEETEPAWDQSEG